MNKTKQKQKNCTKYTEDDVRKLARGGAQVYCRL